MKRTGLLLISLFAIPAMLASPAFSQKIVGYATLGAPYTHGFNVWSTPNPRTNKIYVSDVASPGKIIVVNGATRTISSTITAGTYGSEIRVNSTTNKVYAFDGTNIYVIDGSTDQIVATIPPVTNDGCVVAIALDTGLNQIVALDPCSKTGYVLDASGNLLTTVSVPLGTMVDYQVNPTNHNLYVVDDIDHEFVVANLKTGTSTTVSVGNKWPQSVAIDTKLNVFYMADATLNQVYVFDGATNALINQFQPPSGPFVLDVNQKTHVIAISDGGQTVYFYHSNLTPDGSVSFPTAKKITYISVNPATNRSYVGVMPRNALAFIAMPTS
jgi:DNA-binding beta-propeller fold protein YncE